MSRCAPSTSVRAVLFCALLHSSAALLQLHVKAGPDGSSIGDCPFAQAIRLVAGAKNLDVAVLPHGPKEKPAWLVEDYGGKMPCLVVEEGSALVESRVIANWLESTYPTPALSDSPALEPGEAAAQPIFGSFARYCKALNDDAESLELKKELLLNLCNLDAHLAQTANPYLCGDRLSMADCFLLPSLYHIRVAGKFFKGFDIPEQFTSLHQYMDMAMATPLLQACTPPEAMVRWGWANARGDEAAAAAAAAEC